MKVSKTIEVIDSHTAGQATRVVVSGVPYLKGNTMMEKKKYLAKHYDSIRTITMLEPRGHADMFGAVLVEPIHEEADSGIIFIDGAGYLNMCGHGTIGVATVMVETGMVEVREPYTYITLDSPAGLIKTKVKVEDGQAIEVSFTNVPSFLYKKDVEVSVPELGTVKFDIAFGGSFFAIIEDKELGIEISRENVNENIPVALKFLKYIAKHVEVEHPLMPDINEIQLVEVYGKPKSEKADVQNMVVLGEGEVDRSPCGTGTCAKMATLYSRDKLSVDQDFVHESVLNTLFRGKILSETSVGSYKAIIPQITGSAYITGFNHLVVDPSDPLKDGFKME